MTPNTPRSAPRRWRNLSYDAESRRVVLTVDGRKVAETVLKEPLGPLSKLYVRGNDTQLLNNFVVLPQK